MSGVISGNKKDDLFQHYCQRLNEISQKNHNKSLATSTVGSLSESTVNGQYFNSKGQIANGTLTTHQFYNNNSNQDHRIQAENIPLTQHLMEGSSTCGGETDSSVFKRPLPVKRFYCKPHIERRLDFVVDSLRSIKDKPTLKFLITTNETLLHALKNPPAQPVNPVHIIDYVSNLVREEYLSKRVPKSICGSSVTSDQASNIDQYAGNSERSIRLDRPSGTAQVSDSRVVLEDITQLSMYRQCNRPPQGLNNSEYSSIGRTGLLSYHHSQETSTGSEAARERDRLSSGQRLPDTLTEGTLAGSTFNLFNDTEIAQRRDEAAASQGKSHAGTVFPERTGKTLVKSTPKPTINSSKVSRVIKASATANKKPSNGRSKLSVPVSENCLLDHSNKDISLLNGTANGISRSGRTLRCPIKYWNAKGEELSCEDIDENTRKAVKKPAPKRKSKESNDMITKKKKVEDPAASDVEEADIFGTVTYRKPTHQNLKTALSLSAALLSAKKAAGEAQGKATPPCKAIGDMMANESIHSTRSAAKEAPKPNEAIKRIIKKMEKDQIKAPTQSKAKPQVKNTRKDNSQLNDLMEAAKSTFSVANPVCSATLTVFRGNSRESDLSDTEEDDDGEDDDDDLM